MDYPISSDGLPARDSGEWAREKLWYVERYIGIFNQGMKKHWADRAYVDLMAGPGRCIVSQTGAEFPGSAVLALQSKVPFTQAILIEQDPVPYAALSVRCNAPDLKPTPTLLQADCNSPEAVRLIRERVRPESTLAFCFVDLLGFDVAFETITAITATRRIDLVITIRFATRKTRRFIGRSSPRNTPAEATTGRRSALLTTTGRATCSEAGGTSVHRRPSSTALALLRLSG
jgi:three-Cys-motif partner protein